jgi:phage shock protein C
MREAYKRENPHRLYRDKQNAVIAGVCAGIANYFGFNRKGVRVATVLIMFCPPFIPFVVVSYIILAILIPVMPVELKADDERAVFWRNVSNAPIDVFGSLRHRFKELNVRLEKMEAYVTSKEFEFDRELGRKTR